LITIFARQTTEKLFVDTKCGHGVETRIGSGALRGAESAPLPRGVAGIMPVGGGIQ
jgi:hypothetical protein